MSKASGKTGFDPLAGQVADVLIVGAGLSGLTLAVALGRTGLNIAVLDRQKLSSTLATTFDGRVTAIAYSSWQLMQAIGVWEGMADDAQPILDIRVTDGVAPVFLNFDHAALGDEPFGYMVENRHIRAALMAALAKMDNVALVAPADLDRVDDGPVRAVAHLADGSTVPASLVVAADGRASALREKAGISTIGHGYNQMGIVTTIEHEHDHQGIAHERFLTPGPFAILPIKGNKSSLVWSEAPDTAKALLALPNKDFNAQIATRVGGFLGTVKAVGPRFSYPYAVHVAERFVADRLALIGDAAHGIHPIAGQGLNLGWRDVAALSELVVDNARLGLDVGSSEMLARYDRWRRVDSLTLAAVTDALNALFSNDIAPVRAARDAGLAVVNRIDPLKKLFMSHARGTVGKLPRLLKGESLL